MLNVYLGILFKAFGEKTVEVNHRIWTDYNSIWQRNWWGLEVRWHEWIQVQVGHERCVGRNIWENRECVLPTICLRTCWCHLKLFWVPMRILEYSQHFHSFLLMVKHMVIFAVWTEFLPIVPRNCTCLDCVAVSH